MNNEMNLSPSLSTNTDLSIKEIVKEAWANTDGFKGKCWIAVIILVIAAIGLEVLSHAASPGGLNSLSLQPSPSTLPQFSLAFIIIQIIGRILYYLLFYGLVYMAIRRTNNLTVQMGMLFSTFKYPRSLQIIGWIILKFLLVFACFVPLFIPSMLGMFLPHTNSLKLISGIIFILGIILVLVGAIYYVMLRLSMTSLVILDKGLNPIEALKLSYSATKGNALRIFAIYLLTILIILVSIIPLGIGLIWSIPFTALVYPAVYRRLIGITTKE